MTNSATSLECRNCGSAYEKPKRGPTSAYCSKGCRAQFEYAQSVDGVAKFADCQMCEFPFETSHKNASYCPVCKPLKGKSVYQCPGCNKQSVAQKGLSGYCKACSPLYGRNAALATQASLKSVARKCRHCDNSFEPVIPVQAFCSPSCNNKHWSRRKYASRRAAFIEDVSLAYIFERDGGVCQICKHAVDLTIDCRDAMSASIDHILPVTHGGEHSKRNCQLAHLGCNASKGRSRGYQQLLVG